MIQVQAIDHLSSEQLIKRFNDARSREYQALIKDLSEPQKGKAPAGSRIASLRRRLEEITTIDFFRCPLRIPAEELLASITRVNANAPAHQPKTAPTKRSEFQNRTWVTRPRPGIDRAASAWLIKRFIDLNAKFAFSSRADALRGAVPFDTFEGTGFSHVGEACTFETLCKEFGIRDPRVTAMAEIIHDADLRDGKFGRGEGIALDAVLSGWSEQGLEDEALLARGIELFEGFFRSMK